MTSFVQILIIIILIIAVLYFVMPSSGVTEGFSGIQPGYNGDTMNQGFKVPDTGYRPGHARRHPDQDIVYATINNKQRNPDASFEDGIDQETLDRLKDTILTDISRTSKTQVAYNDVASYRPDRIRPFNDLAARISEAQADNGKLFADQFDNTFYRLWEADENKEKDRVIQRAFDIKDSGKQCIDFEHVNQCMSVCTNTENCTGFYIDAPHKCCMMPDPPYVYSRHSYNKPINNIDKYGYRTLNELIRRAEAIDGKIVFDYIRTDNGNDSYKVDMDREQCKTLCPKCIVGRCPKNYRCTNMTADPRYNYNCIITNEGRYDETSGHTFDSKSVPYLDSKYAINEYAGFDDLNTKPVLFIPPSERIQLDQNITPNAKELQTLLGIFDSNHVGPHTFQNFAPKTNPLTDDKQNFKPNNSGCQKNDKIEASDTCNIVEGFDQFLKKGYDKWQNRDCYDPEEASDNPDFIAVRGGNDPINLEGYWNRKNNPYFRKPTVTGKMIEYFGFNSTNGLIPKDRQFAIYSSNSENY